MDTAARLTDLVEPTGETLSGESALAERQQRFGKISRRTRDLWQTPLFQHRPASRLRFFGEQALSLSRQICDDLIALAENSENDVAADWTTLDDLLTANESLLDWLTDRIHAAEIFPPIARQLDLTINRIVRGDETSLTSLNAIAAEWTALAQRAPALTFQTAADVAVLPEIFGHTDPENGITASLCSAWLLFRDEAKESTRRLMIAALVQDIGAYAERSLRLPGEARVTPTHPSTGAAILAGLDGVPAEIPLLVGAHHERRNGSGFPQRLSGASFTTSAQRLAWAVRFSELIVDAGTVSATIESGESLDVVAGIRLWREVEQGAFDSPLVTRELDAVRHGLSKEVAERYPELHRRFALREPLNESRSTPWRLDQLAPVASVLGPRFLRRSPGRPSVITPVVPSTEATHEH
ncbi:MAG TPA: HD domain-containing phosphohydrolase [Planctomycetaceae bacterium]|nr:HD domain-containing phosphohydrolase [Planctomycetaceae bacterium]